MTIREQVLDVVEKKRRAGFSGRCAQRLVPEVPRVSPTGLRIGRGTAFTRAPPTAIVSAVMVPNCCELAVLYFACLYAGVDDCSNQSESQSLAMCASYCRVVIHGWCGEPSLCERLTAAGSASIALRYRTGSAG